MTVTLELIARRLDVMDAKLDEIRQRLRDNEMDVEGVVERERESRDRAVVVDRAIADLHRRVAKIEGGA